jgi:hypothetical protein
MALLAEGVASAEPPAEAKPTSAAPAPAPAAAAQPAVTSGPKKGSANPVIDWNRLASTTTASSGLASLQTPRAGGPIPVPDAKSHLQDAQGDGKSPSASGAGPTVRVAPPPSAEEPDAASMAATARTLVVRNQIMPAAKTCYQNDPSSKTGLPGRLALLINVGPTGAVQSVTVGINAGVAPGLVSCITAAARAATFEASTDGVTVVPASFLFPMRP